MCIGIFLIISYFTKYSLPKGQNMKLTEKEIAEIMLSTIITKHGLMLNSKQCAQEIRASKSSRGLDEDRKAGKQCVPEYIDDTRILYPSQYVVAYHLLQCQNSIKINNA